MWAKVEGYRWWPAHVLDPNDHREEMRDAPKLPDRAKPVLVRFHHTQDIGFMAPSKVLDFAEHVKEKSAGGKKGGGRDKGAGRGRRRRVTWGLGGWALGGCLGGGVRYACILNVHGAYM